jgi:hypothetical protein
MEVSLTELIDSVERRSARPGGMLGAADSDAPPVIVVEAARAGDASDARVSSRVGASGEPGALGASR